MNIIAQQVDTWGYCPNTVEETMNWIERAARVCYQSQEKIGDGSAEKMCKMLITKEHTAMIEHSWLAVKIENANGEADLPAPLLNDHFLHCEMCEDEIYIVGNYRAWLNHVLNETTVPQVFGIGDWEIFITLIDKLNSVFDMYDLDYQIINNEDLPEHLRAITARFITSRDVTHEFVRHRRFMAYAQKSQRYCADREHVDFVLPSWALSSLNIMGTPDQKVQDTMEWLQAMSDAEMHYHELLKTKSPQEARVVLPNSCATEIVATAPVFQWKWVEHLRTSSAAYPAIRELIGLFHGQREVLLAQG